MVRSFRSLTPTRDRPNRPPGGPPPPRRWPVAACPRSRRALRCCCPVALEHLLAHVEAAACTTLGCPRSHMPGSFGGESVPNTRRSSGISLANVDDADCSNQPDHVRAVEDHPQRRTVDAAGLHAEVADDEVEVLELADDRVETVSGCCTGSPCAAAPIALVGPFCSAAQPVEKGAVGAGTRACRRAASSSCSIYSFTWNSSSAAPFSGPNPRVVREVADEAIGYVWTRCVMYAM